MTYLAVEGKLPRRDEIVDRHQVYKSGLVASPNCAFHHLNFNRTLEIYSLAILHPIYNPLDHDEVPDLEYVGTWCTCGPARGSSVARDLRPHPSSIDAPRWLSGCRYAYRGHN